MSIKIERTIIGDAEIIQLVEMDIGHCFGWLMPDNKPESIKEIEWLHEPYRTQDYHLKAVSQSFIIKRAGRVLVVDSCIGDNKIVNEFPDWSHMQTDFLEKLAEAGISRDMVTDVLCTHLHFDHVGWNTYLKDGKWLPTFPRAKHHFAREEYYDWQDFIEKNPEDTQSFSFHNSIMPIIEAGLENFIDPPTDLGDGFTVFPTPGHTRSHVAVRIDAGEESFIIAGDTMHHPCQIARPHWATIVDYDQAQSTATRRKLLAELDGQPTLMACIHFNTPSFGRITKDKKDGFIFHPRS